MTNQIDKEVHPAVHIFKAASDQLCVYCGNFEDDPEHGGPGEGYSPAILEDLDAKLDQALARIGEDPARVLSDDEGAAIFDALAGVLKGAAAKLQHAPKRSIPPMAAEIEEPIIPQWIREGGMTFPRPRPVAVDFSGLMYYREEEYDLYMAQLEKQIVELDATIVELRQMLKGTSK